MPYQANYVPYTIVLAAIAATGQGSAEAQSARRTVCDGVDCPRAEILPANLIMKRHILIFGLAGGFLIALLQYFEYRFLIIEHSVEIYGALVAILFATFGIWLGLRIAQKRRPAGEPAAKEAFVPAETAVPGSFTPNTANRQSLGITARELEILTLIAAGFSNREIAAQLFVSENTVKTHCARAFEKLGAARRTQAVNRCKELGLLP
jgi:two-component system, NarL family, response regulator LiaR